MTATPLDRCVTSLDTISRELQAGMAEADAMISDLRAERDALRERCEKLEWLVEVQEFVVYFDPTSTLDNACVELAASWKYAELCAALATEVKP